MYQQSGGAVAKLYGQHSYHASDANISWLCNIQLFITRYRRQCPVCKLRTRHAEKHAPSRGQIQPLQSAVTSKMVLPQHRDRATTFPLPPPPPTHYISLTRAIWVRAGRPPARTQTITVSTPFAQGDDVARTPLTHSVSARGRSPRRRSCQPARSAVVRPVR